MLCKTDLFCVFLLDIIFSQSVINFESPTPTHDHFETNNDLFEIPYSGRFWYWKILLQKTANTLYMFIGLYGTVHQSHTKINFLWY